MIDRRTSGAIPLRQRLRRDADGYTEWVRLTDTPLLVLALLFLVVLLAPFATRVNETERIGLTCANVVIWGAFAVDYLARLYLASDRRNYMRRNVLDLVIVVVPFLRPMRAFRLLRLIRLASVTGVVNKRLASLHARVTAYVASAALVSIGVAAFAIYGSERHAASSNIKTLPDALWWAVTTVTTVGYGDRYPTTSTGRVIAVCLMVVGIALLGVITAAVAAWFVNRLQPVQQAEERTEATLTQVLSELRRLHERLDLLETPGGSRD